MPALNYATNSLANQSDILERFSSELPNSHFGNGGITRNWSNLFMSFC